MSLNITSPNITLNSVDQFLAIWKNTRAMKASGWLYKASADGTNTKDTSSNPVLDYWGPGGIVAGNIQLGAQTGSGASSTTSATTMTLTSLSGMTSASVGHALTLSGATNTGNNGTFTIVNFVSSSSVRVFNPNLNGGTETGTLVWSERVSGSASITWSSIANGREQTITGLSGMTVNSPGHQIYLQGSANANNNGVFNILSFVSATSVVVINNNVGAGSNTNSGQWTELDPLLDVYPGSFQSNAGSGCWINLQGPSTLKIPISAASVGTFIKGENITQSVSNAQGELLGYQFNVAANFGFLVVMPRVNGTGAGARGWSTGVTTITGAASAATVTTASSTPSEYIREMVFWKGTTSQLIGTWYYQCVDGYTTGSETSSRFSSLATQTGATATIAPGGGGTNNTFPLLGTCAIRGTGGSQSGTTWIWSSTATVAGKTLSMVANSDYTTGSSADGSWTLAVGYPATNSGAFVGLGFYRVDNNEDGDVDPYVAFSPNSTASSPYLANRNGTQTPPSGANISTDHFSCNNNNGTTFFCGFRRRGFASGDSFQQFNAASLSPVGTSQTNFVFTFTVDNDSIATSIASVPPRVRDPIWVISNQTTQAVTNQLFGKMRKGTIRWGFMLAGGNGGDTYDGRRWIQLSSLNGSWVMGPWDGITTPSQT